MGIVEDLLAEFELDTYGVCRLEADVNGTVHIHLGQVRVELSEREFHQFASVIEDAQDRLHRMKAPEEHPRSDLDAERPPLDAV